MNLRRHESISAASARELPNSPAASSRIITRLQDAVYREMYRLEARQPGSELGLALALLRIIVASQKLPGRDENRKWLKEICPVALKMIDDSLDSFGECTTSSR